MEQIYKYFLLFCFVVVFLSGCSNGPDKVSVKAATGKSGTATDKNGRKVVDRSKLSNEEKQSVDLMAKDVAMIMYGMKVGDQVFQAIWSQIWKERKTNVHNVFEFTYARLKAQYSENGLKYEDQEVPCKGPQYYLDVTSFDEINKVVVPKVYTLAYGSCGANATGKGKSSGTEYVKITVHRNDNAQDSYEVEFLTENLKGYTSLSNEVTKGNKKSTCVLVPAADLKLTKMDCEQISQNYSSEEYLVMNQIHYDSTNSEHPLTVTGTAWDALLKKKLDFKVQDIPLTNTLKIVASYPPPPVEDAPEKTQPTPAAPVVAPTGPTTTAPEAQQVDPNQDYAEPATAPSGEVAPTGTYQGQEGDAAMLPAEGDLLEVQRQSLESRGPVEDVMVDPNQQEHYDPAQQEPGEQQGQQGHPDEQQQNEQQNSEAERPPVT
ncbi:MAG: hypothetical protein COT73_10950 [Bdellovibrio sp. CG10_big_fil_rev_8_21_14_0_10_47_8]|nr:MAG: hypothetical protein COT73_10950 [Bdellovibrio sp. CG10_big_fil_rev_8_21_14_0_10_47_8]